MIETIAVTAVVAIVFWKLVEWTAEDYYTGTVLPAAKALLRGEVRGLRIAEADAQIAAYRRFEADLRVPHLVVVDALHDCAVGIALALVALGLGGLAVSLYADPAEDLKFAAWFSAVLALAFTTAVVASSSLARVKATARRLRDPDGYRERLRENVEWILRKAGESDERVAERLSELDLPLGPPSP